MKYASLIFSALAVSLTGMAYVSPLRSAQDYTFTRPSMTNLISGFIMGETPSYFNVRYEDAAFVHEAMAERMFVLGNGNYDTGERTKKGFPIVEHPVNRFYNSKSEAIEEYLHPSEKLSNSIRLITPASNVVTRYEWECVGPDGTQTGITWTVTNVIEQVMTNMTVDAYTNAPISWRTNHIIEVTTTNAMRAADWCMETRCRDFDEYIENVQWSRYSVNNLIDLGYFTNAYRILKSTTRTKPIAAKPGTGTMSFTNEMTVTYWYGTDVLDWTINTHIPYYSKNITLSYGLKEGSCQEPKGVHHVSIRTPLPYASNTTGGVKRVTGAYVFCTVGVTRTTQFIGESSQPGIIKEAIAMVPLGRATPMQRSEDDKLYLELAIEDFKGIASAVADLAGIQFDVIEKEGEYNSILSTIGPYPYSSFYVVLETTFKTTIPGDNQ